MLDMRKGVTLEKLILIAIGCFLSGWLILTLYNLTLNGIVTSQISADLQRGQVIQKDLKELCTQTSSLIPLNPEEGREPLATEGVRFSNSLKEVKIVNDEEGPYFIFTWKNQDAKLALEGCYKFGNVDNYISSKTNPHQVVGAVHYDVYRRAYYNATDQQIYVNVTFEEI